MTVTEGAPNGSSSGFQDEEVDAVHTHGLDLVQRAVVRPDPDVARGSLARAREPFGDRGAQRVRSAAIDTPELAQIVAGDRFVVAGGLDPAHRASFGERDR